MRINCAGVLMLLLGAACDKPKMGASSDSLRVSASPAAARVPDAVSRRLASADSSLLEFEGYYMPTTSPVLNDHTLKWLGIYAPPRSAGIFVAPRSLSDADTVSAFFECPGATVTRDTLDLTCPGTPWGVVHIQGSFTDRTGRFAERYGKQEDVSSGTVLAARVSVEREGRIVTIAKLEFTWFAGD